MNWMIGKSDLLQDMDGTVVDPNKVGWPDLKYDNTIDKYVYKDNMCTAYAATTTFGSKWHLELEIIPKHFGLSKECHSLTNIKTAVYINTVVGELITKWQKDKGNAGLIKHYKLVNNGEHKNTTKLGIANRLRIYGITEAEIQQRCDKVTAPKIKQKVKKKEPGKRHWLECLSDAVRGIKCTS